MVRIPEGLSAKGEDNPCWEYTGAVRVGAHHVQFPFPALFPAFKGYLKGMGRFRNHSHPQDCWEAEGLTPHPEWELSCVFQVSEVPPQER